MFMGFGFFVVSSASLVNVEQSADSEATSCLRVGPLSVPPGASSVAVCLFLNKRALRYFPVYALPACLPREKLHFEIR